MKHIGYSARTAERFRYPNDPREIALEISKEAAVAIAKAVAATLGGGGIESHNEELIEVVSILDGLGIEP